MAETDTPIEPSDGWRVWLDAPVPYPLALHLKLTSYAENGTCGSTYRIFPDGYAIAYCTRGAEHPGRHLAGAETDNTAGPPIVAAWPGTHTPVLGDLTGGN